MKKSKQDKERKKFIKQIMNFIAMLFVGFLMIGNFALFSFFSMVFMMGLLDGLSEGSIELITWGLVILFFNCSILSYSYWDLSGKTTK